MTHYTRKLGLTRLDATKVPSALDIAWTAGIYEGEGCCRNCGRGKRSLAVGIAQKDPEILYRVRDWFGGSVRPNWVTYKGQRYALHTLHLCGDRARLFLATIYSYLSARRKSQVLAINALEFLGEEPTTVIPMLELQHRLDNFYINVRSHQWRGDSEESKAARRKYDREKMRVYRQAKRDKKAVVISIAG
jgi:hypothetical protein